MLSYNCYFIAENLAYETLEDGRKKHVYNLVLRCIGDKEYQGFLKTLLSLIEMSRSDRQGRPVNCAKRTEAAKESFYYSGCQIYNCFKSM